MFRLLAVLLTILIMGILWVTVFDSTFGGDDGDACERAGLTTTTSPVKVSKGIEDLLNRC